MIKAIFRTLNKPYLKIIKAEIDKLKIARKFVIKMDTSHATVKNNDFAGRTYIMTLGAFGLVHLDFTTSNNPQKFDVIGNFPDDAPLPTHLVEVQTFDGGTVFLGQGKRFNNKGKELAWAGDGYILIGSTLQANQRYVLNMFGFFNKR